MLTINERLKKLKKKHKYEYSLKFTEVNHNILRVNSAIFEKVGDDNFLIKGVGMPVGFYRNMEVNTIDFIKLVDNILAYRNAQDVIRRAEYTVDRIIKANRGKTNNAR